ncbi:Rrf2 family transcriptional regulator [Pimelobacter simplex]|uniref:Rrf2 family transcriptional regulator n=1 Tax=Nocardioides simplex TaxID=2045 RepID=A0A7J5DW64_NOCSI|nr:Rrf2 family transcriptional regulator [Pimelobacter simplex]KAB2809557.1 Rrf2 family transcriptional regulator [Pimelobacter simplex]
MRMNEGVEWAAHVCVLLHWLHEDDGPAAPAPIPVARMAEAYDLPAAYLVKQVQALTRAGITESVPGKYGGVRLARPAGRITLMEVVAAIEGPDDAFACTEIRQRGMNEDRPARDFAKPCGIAHAMREAELAWRRELAATSILDLAARTPRRVAADARRHFART